MDHGGVGIGCQPPPPIREGLHCVQANRSAHAHWGRSLTVFKSAKMSASPSTSRSSGRRSTTLSSSMYAKLTSFCTVTQEKLDNDEDSPMLRMLLANGMHRVVVSNCDFILQEEEMLLSAFSAFFKDVLGFGNYYSRKVMIALSDCWSSSIIVRDSQARYLMGQI